MILEERSHLVKGGRRMRWIALRDKKDIKKYIRFIKALYKEDTNYRDYLTPIVKEMLMRQSVFARKIQAVPYLIYEQEELVGVVTFMIHEAYKDVLQIALLEYKNRKGKVIEAILEEAYEVAREKNAKQIVVGLNGHVNYGLGLSETQNRIPTFGSSYTKDYYIQDLNGLGGEEIRLTSYEYPWNPPLFPMPVEKLKRLNSCFSFRVMTRKTFKEDIGIYTRLNNEAFKKHLFYFPRTEEEDYELFKTLKFFMTKGSLIFAEYNGEPIGFLLWYPDWGEAMKQGETVSIRTYLKKCLGFRKPTTFKIVEWGVIPKYQGKGVPIGLLYRCYELVKDKGYKKCKTSWIIDDNTASSGFGMKWARPYEHYKAYQFTVDEGIRSGGILDGEVVEAIS